MFRISRIDRILICGAAVTLAACASTPDPKPEIEAARALVTQAEQSGAAEFAGADIQAARDRLQRAEDENNANHDEAAARLADEAAVNAKLALARTSAAKAERGAEETAEGVEALREEANRPSPDSKTTTDSTTTTP